MKKKSTSQSAFFNVRVLIGLFVCMAGVFLALFATANPSGFGFGPATGFAQNQGVTTREEMALTLAQALGAFQPPACVPGAEMFSDVPASNGFCPWIEEMARRGITGGCGGGKFCPHDPVLREQMAVFLVKIVASEAFHLVGTTGEPPFENGWVNIGLGLSQAGFFKDSLGIVHLKGTLTGPSGLSAFTLPAGYRPAEHQPMPIAGSGAIAAYILVRNDGQVTPVCAGGGTCGVGLNGLTFRLP